MAENEKGIRKHADRLCRLDAEENDFTHKYHGETVKLHRKTHNSFGLPTRAIMAVNGKVKYDAGNKIWIGAICNKKNAKYKRGGIINRVISKHGDQ